MIWNQPIYDLCKFYTIQHMVYCKPGRNWNEKWIRNNIIYKKIKYKNKLNINYNKKKWNIQIIQ